MAGYDVTPAAPSPINAPPVGGYAQQPAPGATQMFTPGLAAQQGAGGAGGYFVPPVGGGGIGQTQVPAQQVPAVQPQVQGYAGGYAGVQGVTDGMRGLGVGDKVSCGRGEDSSGAWWFALVMERRIAAQIKF